jgi:hypothetical protein
MPGLRTLLKIDLEMRSGELSISNHESALRDLRLISRHPRIRHVEKGEAA